jgi:dipeptidyl-peptidase 4
MKKQKLLLIYLYIYLLVLLSSGAAAQAGADLYWMKDGSAYRQVEDGDIVEYSLPDHSRRIIIPRNALVPPRANEPLTVERFAFSDDGKQALIFTNTQRVWRQNTRGDYWLYDVATQALRKVGKDRPASSLMFAKFSPDSRQVAYVSEYNLYTEDLASGQIKQLSTDGNRKRMNGTFDWAYEEEFFCRDGFRWSPDSKKIAYWQIDATKVRDYLMVNNTDSIYPYAIPVEYPKVGEQPSPYRIGIADIATGNTTWMRIPGDPSQHYLPRMEWAANAHELIAQQLTRKQNETRLFICNASTGEAREIYHEKDEAWIDILPLVDQDYADGGWDWINGGQEFLWVSEKDGWRHLYRISRDGKRETLITTGNYDLMDICSIDEKGGYVYFMASPQNATQKYLYRVSLRGKGKAERMSPLSQPGTHTYQISPNGKYALHQYSNHYLKPLKEWISLPGHKSLDGQQVVTNALARTAAPDNVSFFRVKTSEDVEMDGWLVKPRNFDPNKKYPVVFYVYTEPWGQNVKDEYGSMHNFLYRGNMADDGYIYISIDNRGTPVPKGREWRKSIYRKIGVLNIRDQALAAQQILQWPFVDAERVAVWGWSGGGSATLNLMFQYPQIYKTGIAIAAVANQLTYDNIYQERYMGIPQENPEDFISGSPITHAKNLSGNLLYIHGTGDDNVHYQNAEMLLNELIKHNRQFQFMPYPNRSHSMAEGEGTFLHLQTLYTNFLKQHCPPGGR